MLLLSFPFSLSLSMCVFCILALLPTVCTLFKLNLLSATRNITKQWAVKSSGIICMCIYIASNVTLTHRNSSCNYITAQKSKKRMEIGTLVIIHIHFNFNFSKQRHLCKLRAFNNFSYTKFSNCPRNDLKKWYWS